MDQTFFVSDDLYASAGQRFLNYVIDFIVQYSLFFVLGLILGLIERIYGRPGILEWIANMNTLEEYAFGSIVILIYYSAMEMTLSRTVGKYITGTIVVDVYGDKPETSDIFKRTCCRLIPFDFFSYLASKPRGWHDKIPGLYVVDVKRLEEARQQFQDFNEFGNTVEAI